MSIKKLRKKELKFNRKLILIKEEISILKSKLVINKINRINWEKKYSHLNQPK